MEIIVGGPSGPDRILDRSLGTVRRSCRCRYIPAAHALAPRGAWGIFIASTSLQLVVTKTAAPICKPVIARGLKPDVRQKCDTGQEKACYALAPEFLESVRPPWTAGRGFQQTNVWSNAGAQSTTLYVVTSTRRVARNRSPNLATPSARRRAAWCSK